MASGKPKSPKPTQAELAIAEMLDGPTETIAASIPRRLAQHLRKRIERGRFSQFVTRAITREAIRLNRLALVANVERATGPLDPEAVEAAERLLLE